MADFRKLDAGPARPPTQWSLGELLYGVALIGAATATFGWTGLGAMVIGAAVLLVIHSGRRPTSLVLAEAGLLALAIGVASIALISPARVDSRGRGCATNLKQMGLAVFMYESTYNRFPPAHYTDAVDKPIHSWRVLMWPFYESNSTYAQYKFTEPWDGPNNQLLLRFESSLFHCPARAAGTHSPSVSYFAIVGDNAPFLPNTGRKLKEFEDTSHTILFLEHSGRDQHWMAPGDLSFEEAVKLLTAESTVYHDTGGHPATSFFFVPTTGRMAAMADGSVQFIPSGLSEEVARHYLQVRKERPLAEHEMPGKFSFYGRPNWGNWLRMGIFLLLALVPAVCGWLRTDGASQNAIANGQPPGDPI